MAKGKPPILTEEQVLDYLISHPEFFASHPEALPEAPPSTSGNVVELQGFMVGRLQTQLKEARHECDELAALYRDHTSHEKVAHDAALAIIGARTLEQLLAVLTIDMLTRLNVDLIRVGLESGLASAYGAQYHEDNYSGVALLDVGVVEELLVGKPTRVLPDTRKLQVEGLYQVWTEGVRQVQSCVLLRLWLPRLKRVGLLALGAKTPNHFKSKDATQLLQFVARVLELKLDHLLFINGDEEWI